MRQSAPGRQQRSRNYEQLNSPSQHNSGYRCKSGFNPPGLHLPLLFPNPSLTAQDFDASSMLVVLRSDQWPHADDQQITKASDEGNDPDGHSQHHVSQQVLKGRNTIRIGLTGTDMGRIRAVLECLEIAGRRREEEDGGATTRARYS